MTEKSNMKREREINGNKAFNFELGQYVWFLAIACVNKFINALNTIVVRHLNINRS